MPFAATLEYLQSTVLKHREKLLCPISISSADKSQRAIRTYNALMNIITDLALATITTLMVLPLQITSERRDTLLLGFWCRIVYVNSLKSVDLVAEDPYRVVIASATQVVYIQALNSYTNLLNTIWRVVVCGQVVQVTSIMTATVPFLKPFLTSLESDFIGANAATRTATSGHDTVGNTEPLPSYVRLGSSRSREQPESRDKQGDIWVRMEYMVQRESRLGADRAKEADSPNHQS